MFYLLFLFIVSLFVFRVFRGVRVDRSITLFIAGNLVALSLYIFVDTLSGNGFDESVVYHLIYGIEGAGVLAFVPYITAVLIVIALLVFLAFWSSSDKLNGDRRADSRLFSAMIFLGLAICFLKNPLVIDLREQLPVFRAVFSQNGQLDTELSRFKGTSLGRLVVNEADTSYFGNFEGSSSVKRKNIIWIYAESLERTYFKKEVFGDLLANLSVHAEGARRYSSVNQPWGTGWTIGGIVGSQCGLPLVTLGAENVNSLANVQNFMPGVQCFGDILKRDGYTLEFVGGASGAFAGKGNFLKSHGFNTIWDREALREKFDDGTHERNQWGYYDDFTFGVLKNRALELHGKGSPFFLNGLTLDTHSPHGFVSPACKSVPSVAVTDQITAAIRCSDILLANFIDWFKSSDLYDDTVLVLSSDHLSMPNSLYHELSRLSDDRRLIFWMFGKDILSGSVDKEISTFDLGATVLGQILPGQEVAIGLGRNIEEVDGLYGNHFSDDDLRTAVSGIKAFAWREAGVAESLIIDSARKAFSLGGQSYPFPALIEVRDDKYSGISWTERERKEAFLDLIEPESSYVWLDVCGWSIDSNLSGSGRSCAHLVNKGEIVDSVILDESVVNIDVEEVLDVYRSRATERELIVDMDYAVSNSGSGGVGGILGVKTLRAGRGVNFFEKSGDSLGWRFISNIDLCADPHRSDSASYEIPRISKLTAVVVNDSAHCGNVEDLQALGDAIGLKHLGSLNFRQPYIAIIESGKSPIEYRGSVGSSTIVALSEL